MFVYPKWLKISNDLDSMVFEGKDLDAGMSEMYKVVNGGLSDVNIAEIPYEGVGWYGMVKERTNVAPSWRGHIHDGISARRLAGGYVGPDDIRHDGSLGVLNHPETDDVYVSTFHNQMGILGKSTNVITGFMESPGVTYLLSGEFSVAGTASAGHSSFLYDYYGGHDVRAPMIHVCAPVPVDLAEINGILINPVAVASVGARMKSDIFPGTGLENDHADHPPESRFNGMGIEGIDFFSYWQHEEVDPAGRHGAGAEGYHLLFRLILPGADHRITKAVDRWVVTWMLLVRELPFGMHESDDGGGPE